MQGSVVILGGQFNPAILGNISVPAVFESAEFGSLRVVERDGEPWFVASDVARALGYEKPNNAVNDHCKKVNKITQRLESGQPPFHFNIIPESDVYRLIMRSNLPGAERFQDWVCEEVLPSIRRTGVYLPNFRNPIEAAEAWIAAERARLEAEQAAQIEHERAEYYRATKAEIGSRREATAMATASAATRKASTLENELGRGKVYKQVKAIPWLLDEFEESRAMYQQVGKKLKSISDRMGYATNMIPCPEYPDGVKAYHIDVIEAFRVALMTDLNMLSKYRKRKH